MGKELTFLMGTCIALQLAILFLATAIIIAYYESTNKIIFVVMSGVISSSFIGIFAQIKIMGK